MTEHGIVTADDWRRMAGQEMEAARALLDKRLWQQAHHHAGFAIECALKACIMRRRRMNRWPDRAERRDLYNHDLHRLMLEAGLEADLLHEVATISGMGVAWVVARTWSNETRYDPRPFPDRRATDMVFAAEEALSWLATR